MFNKFFSIIMIVGIIVFQSCGGDDDTVTGSGDCTGTVDCAGVCDGSAEVDCAGLCEGTAVEDCNGDCNGTAVADACDVCEGDGSTCTDCAGTPGGDATIESNGCGACTLPANSMYISSGGELWYNSENAIGGLQFTIQGTTLATTNITLLGDAASTDWTLTGSTATGTVLGMSFTGSTVPAGCGLLMQLDLTDASAVTGFGTPGVQFVVSDAIGGELIFTYYTEE